MKSGGKCGIFFWIREKEEERDACKTKGTCAVRIEFDVEDGVVKNVAFLGGCDGNHKGIAALVEGQKPEEVAKKLKGITCGRRTTSCPDQLALALEDFMKNQ